MPGNKIRVGKGSPLKFSRVSPPVNPKYHTVFFDEDWFVNTIKPWQTQVEYFQKWQKTDEIDLQVQANYDPIKLEIRDCAGRTIDTLDFELRNTVIEGQPFQVYELNIQLADLAEGVYYFLLIAGFGDSIQMMVSEGIDLKLSHPDTVLIEYSNSFNKGGIIWDTGIKMAVRVEGEIINYEPGSEDVMYIDQTHDTEPLSSVPYDGFTFAIGGSFGIPDWVAQKINWIFSLDSVFLDGRQFVKAEGAKFEKVQVENYPMNGWTLQISPSRNLDFDEYDDTFDDEVVVTFNIDTALFGIYPPEDGSATIIEIE